MNGDFEVWNNVDTAPNNWNLGGAGGGECSREELILKNGLSSVKISHLTGDFVALYQDISNTSYIANKTFKFECWVYSSDRDSVYLTVSDGNIWYTSKTNSNINKWEKLQLEFAPSGTNLIRLHIWVINNADVIADEADLKLNL